MFLIENEIEEVRKDSEQGFTLIELLVSTGIISILAAISVTFFVFYKQQAEMKKADNDLRNAITSLEITDLDSTPGYSAGPITSATTGGPVSATMAAILPEMVTSPNIELTATYTNCVGRAAGAIKWQVAATSCVKDEYIAELRRCGLTTLRFSGSASC